MGTLLEDVVLGAVSGFYCVQTFELALPPFATARPYVGSCNVPNQPSPSGIPGRAPYAAAMWKHTGPGRNPSDHTPKHGPPGSVLLVMETEKFVSDRSDC